VFAVADRTRSGGGGLFTLVSFVVLVVTVVAVGVAAALLARTLSVAQSISAKAENIATTGRGIDAATDSIIQLERTNVSASGILESAKPLQGALDVIINTAGEINARTETIDGSARSINESATGINDSAGSINNSAVAINENAGGILGSAGSINAAAGGINTTVADILDVAQRVDRDAQNINDALQVTIALASDIRGDTGNIVQEALIARQLSSCIAQKLTVFGLIATSPQPTDDCVNGDS